MAYMADSALESRAGFTNASLMAWLGITEGEVLEFLEAHGPVSLHRLVQGLDRPSSMVVMAVGALIREGLVKGNEEYLEYAGNTKDVSW